MQKRAEGMQKKVERRRRVFGLGDGGEERRELKDTGSLCGGLGGDSGCCGGACLTVGEPVEPVKPGESTATVLKISGVGGWETDRQLQNVLMGCSCVMLIADSDQLVLLVS